MNLGSENMIYITGDIHRDFSRFLSLETRKEDMMIILGDVGINFYLNEEDKKLKESLKKYNMKFFCVRGNHEERPENISTYKEVEMFGGKVFLEEEYPYLIFAKDGETYEIDGKKVLVIGGAYSIDKDLRLISHYPWFQDEQLNKKEQNLILKKVKGNHYDIVLSHTCPNKYLPVESFKFGVEKPNVDKSMELFLDKIEESITYDKWYCGHYYIEKQVDKMEFMYGRMKVFGCDEFVPTYTEEGYEIIRDYCGQNDILIRRKIRCPKCHSKDVVLLKGNGFEIIGNDTIGILCNSCKKLYGFNDVKYYESSPRQL